MAYLSHNPGSSAADLARALEMTPANIRYHLKLLLEEGMIQDSGTRPAGGSGRPQSLYNRSSIKLGESFQPLLAAVLEVIIDQGNEEDLLQKIGSGMVNIKGGGMLSQIMRYNQAVEYLNNLKYHASWEARPGGPRVELRHCPYKDLALSHPQLCTIDQRMISKLFNKPMVLNQKRTFGPNPFSPCIFQSPAQ